MTTNRVFLAWQDTQGVRAWYPIGQLEHEPNSDYHFSYIKGAERAQREAGLEPLPSFPDFERHYTSPELFPLFKNRLLSPKREEYARFIEALSLPPDADSLDILSISGGERATDNFEIFPAFRPDAEGRFRCRFFLHGWRHINPVARERIRELQPEQILRIGIELNNPATELAVQLQTEDYIMLGWTPRYLVKDLISIVNRDNREVTAKVVKVNSDVPTQNRVLIELCGKWPNDYTPFSGEDYQLLVSKGL